jgi:hypothetical protein
MVTPVDGSAISSLLRAQLSAPVSGLKANQSVSHLLIDQLSKPATPAKATAVSQSSKTTSTSGNLPRGSLVDILA